MNYSYVYPSLKPAYSVLCSSVPYIGIGVSYGQKVQYRIEKIIKT